MSVDVSPDVVIVTVGDETTVTPSFCHVMVGEPEAAQVKETDVPSVAVIDIGCCVITGVPPAEQKKDEISH